MNDLEPKNNKKDFVKIIPGILLIIIPFIYFLYYFKSDPFITFQIAPIIFLTIFVSCFLGGLYLIIVGLSRKNKSLWFLFVLGGCIFVTISYIGFVTFSNVIVRLVGFLLLLIGIIKLRYKLKSNA